MKTIYTLIIVSMVMISTSIAQEKDSYYFGKTVNGTFEVVTNRTKSALKKHGFGVVTEIDMDKKLRSKLSDADIKPYRLLGACNPASAYQSIKIEDNIGLFLPCKVLIKDVGNGKVEVVMVDPSVLMGGLNN